MAAYASLLSLSCTLHQIFNLDRYSDPLDKEKIVSLLEKVSVIVNFLEDYSEKHCGAVDRLENRMRGAAYEAEDFMDSYLSFVSVSNTVWSYWKPYNKDRMVKDLTMALERVAFIWEEAMKIKNSDAAEDLRPSTYSAPTNNSYPVKTPAKNVIVGFEDDLIAIKERLYEDSLELQIIPIVGMGGIGKTTLARKSYEDSMSARYFDICAWITVSAEYQIKGILLWLLQDLKKSKNEQSDASAAQLEKQVYQTLFGRRYLIVIDDIWSTKAWDDLKMAFPDDGTGSRILLTTRSSDVAVHAGSSSSPLHQMNFLNEELSWELLQKKIFGQESCPPHLVEIGHKIARSCGGLPLTIAVVAGLLSSDDTTEQEYWENISERISSTEPTIELQCSKILCLSYDRLPLRLKPCFLYITAFPEDFKIDVSKLIKLWAAEGFLKPNNSKCLEDVGEEYLEDLVNRSMILVGKKRADGKLKTVAIHDLLREICLTKAEEDEFIRHILSKKKGSMDVIRNPARRLSIHRLSPFHKYVISNSRVRSVLFFSKVHLRSTISLSCRDNCLNILDAPTMSWPRLSDNISAFVNLRYFSFALDQISCPHGFPASLSNLPNLQTIIVNVHDMELVVPYEIWSMPKLRHLIIMDTPLRVSYPSDIGIVEESDLQTLETVLNFRFTEKTIQILENLKKLKISFTEDFDGSDDFNLDNLFRLKNLEELQVNVEEFQVNVDNLLDVDDLVDPEIIWNHAFPTSLKKLSLNGVPIPWENMSIIGSLPNLHVLKMIDNPFTEGSEWITMEGQFLRLKHFSCSLDYLEKWEVEKDHFPSLESLILKEVCSIEEIPCGIGEIDSLQLIELHHCQESLVKSAEDIQEQQHDNGNDDFQVRVF